MRYRKVVNRIAALLALFIVLLQTFSIPVLASVQPWEGNSWEGDSWKGDSWDAGDLEWEGNPWKGESWEGSGTSGDSWNGAPTQGGSGWDGHMWTDRPWYANPWQYGGWTNPGFNGFSWQGSGFNGNSWSSSGYNGNSWSSSGYNGNSWSSSGYNGNSWSSSGYNGNSWNASGYNGDSWNSSGYNGNPWATPGYNGSPWNNPAYNGSPWAAQGYNGNGWSNGPWSNSGGLYGSPWMSGGGGGAGAIASADEGPSISDISTFVVGDIIGGQVSMIGEYLDGATGFGPSGGFLTGLALNTVKVGLGDKTPWYIDAASDTKSAVDMLAGGYEKGKLLFDMSRGGGLANTTAARGALTTVNNVGALSKFTVAGAAIGAGVAAYDTTTKAIDAVKVVKSDATGAQKVSAVADATASLGETLFNAGAVASAFPGGQAVGAALVVGGAALWGASKLTKLVADNKDAIVNTYNKVKDAVSNGISKGLSKLGGLFGN